MVDECLSIKKIENKKRKKRKKKEAKCAGGVFGQNRVLRNSEKWRGCTEGKRGDAKRSTSPPISCNPPHGTSTAHET